MFNRFARVWTPVALAREPRKWPERRVLAGEPLALWRDEDGRPQAVSDRCPNRGVSLALGKVSASGALECPFHGWALQGEGSCERVPYNPMPERKREHYRVPALPTRELAGMIWVFTDPWESGPGERAVFAQHVWCVPTEANTTEIHLMPTRGFASYRPPSWPADW